MAPSEPGSVGAAGHPVSAARLTGLSPTAISLLREAGADLARGDAAAAQAHLDGALALAPNHPDVLRLAAIAALHQGRARDAQRMLRIALSHAPLDPLLHTNLGSALRATGDADGAIDAFERACALAPDLAAAWYNLGKACRALQFTQRACESLQRAVALAPAHAPARVLLGDTLKTLGRIDEAHAAWRGALEIDPCNAQAWWGIANLNTVRFDRSDAERLRALCTRADAGDEERCLAQFSLARALEDGGDYAGAWSMLHQANAARRAMHPWDAGAFSEYAASIGAAFSGPVATATGDAGAEVVFIVSLPRSGSTLAEQIIASHPEVEGAGELPDLAEVLAAESTRRGQAFPAWVADATAHDWARLGGEYLRRTARWRKARPRSTDKGLDNWMLIGAAAAMLPGARFVDCRREPLETALANYRQWFSEGQRFSYGLSDIAAVIASHARLMDGWARRLGSRLYRLQLEHLQREPEGEIRKLLAGLRLAYDAACLTPHRNTRGVRTASAAQVREPLSRDTRRAHLYGDLLDRLAEALRAAQQHRREDFPSPSAARE
ncbi:MAG: tetratricopeptide repeat protein [Lysobacteraceae bacterium]|nr:MAG: tetratricopeptide repeat protein [Xanthomonadaceae bacterium]